MGEGRGSLDCGCCEFFYCWNPDWKNQHAAGQRGFCTKHAVAIAESLPEHRICGGFVPSVTFAAERSGWQQTFDAMRRRLGEQLDPKCLYRFSPHQPDGLKESGRLR